MTTPAREIYFKAVNSVTRLFLEEKIEILPCAEDMEREAIIAAFDEALQRHGMTRTRWMIICSLCVAEATAPWNTPSWGHSWIDAMVWGIAAFCGLKAIAVQS